MTAYKGHFFPAGIGQFQDMDAVSLGAGSILRQSTQSTSTTGSTPPAQRKSKTFSLSSGTQHSSKGESRYPRYLPTIPLFTMNWTYVNENFPELRKRVKSKGSLILDFKNQGNFNSQILDKWKIFMQQKCFRD